MQASACSDDLEVIQRVAAVSEQRRHRFAGVDGAAAAETDHQVAVLRARERDSAAHQLQRRFTRDLEQHAIQPGRRNRLPHDQQGAAAHRLRRGRHLAHRSGAEDNPGGGGELERHGAHQPSSPGNRFVYFTLVRGSAIISATWSRQTW